MSPFVAFLKRANPVGVAPLFQSNWDTATGASDAAVRDTSAPYGPWTTLNFAPFQVIDVVAGAPLSMPAGYANALRVQQRGTVAYSALDYANLPTSQDYYTRFYMRNDDSANPVDHIVANIFTAPDDRSFFLMKEALGSTWTVHNAWYSLSGYCGNDFNYPVSEWYLNGTLSNGLWYRFEHWIHFFSSDHVQIRPRIYDASGTLIFGPADFRQTDYGGPSFEGSNTWTLGTFWDAHSVCMDPSNMKHWSMGNNSQAGATDTGLYWYYAGVRIQSSPTSGVVWVGP